MNYSSANIQGWQSFSFTWATFLNCHEGFITLFDLDLRQRYDNLRREYLFKKYTFYVVSYFSGTNNIDIQSITSNKTYASDMV